MISLFFHGQELIGLWILYCNILQEISLTLWNLGKFKSSFVQNTENLGCTPDIQAFQGQKIWLLHQSLASRVADPGSTASPASIPSHVSNRWMVWNKQEALHLSIEHCLWWPLDRQPSSLNLKEVYLPSLDTSHNTEEVSVKFLWQASSFWDTNMLPCQKHNLWCTASYPMCTLRTAAPLPWLVPSLSTRITSTPYLLTYSFATFTVLSVLPSSTIIIFTHPHKHIQ